MDADDGMMQQHPAWREAVHRFREQGFRAGDVLAFDWLFDAFGVIRPSPDTPLAEAQRSELEFLSGFKAFEDVLLGEYQIALANVRGVGYRVVPPAEQTAWAEGQGKLELKRALRKMHDRLANVDLGQLDAGQRRENADALARLAQLSGMAKSAMRKRSVLAIED